MLIWLNPDADEDEAAEANGFGFCPRADAWPNAGPDEPSWEGCPKAGAAAPSCDGCPKAGAAEPICDGWPKAGALDDAKGFGFCPKADG